MPEGVILCADSTATVTAVSSGERRFLNNEQKVFEFGEPGRLGAVTWGLGRVGDISLRTLLAATCDATGGSYESAEQAAAAITKTIWPQYQRLVLDVELRNIDAEFEKAKTIGDLGIDILSSIRDCRIASLIVGFCIGGCCLPKRSPEAVSILFSADGPSDPTPVDKLGFWGAVKLIERAVGFDTELIEEIARSEKWTGTIEELKDIFSTHSLVPPYPMPIREGIDMMHSLINTTIKMMKFSPEAPICGGPVEIAVITTDRPFRWVRHKELGAAIG